MSRAPFSHVSLLAGRLSINGAHPHTPKTHYNSSFHCCLPFLLHPQHTCCNPPPALLQQRETLRLDPVVQLLFRQALRDFTLEGYTVPAGKQLLLPLKYLAAHDPRWHGQEQPQERGAGAESCCWPPDAFVPERLLTQEGQKSGDLMPFGWGARCVAASGAGVNKRSTACMAARCAELLPAHAAPHVLMFACRFFAHVCVCTYPCVYLSIYRAHPSHHNRYCLGSGLALAEMKTVLALVARHYTFSADNNTEWQYAIGKSPKVRCSGRGGWWLVVE